MPDNISMQLASTLSFELLLENTVLFDEIVDDRLLVAVKPAGQGNYEEMERLYDACHCRTDYPQYFLITISCSSFEYLHHTGQV